MTAVVASLPASGATASPITGADVPGRVPGQWLVSLVPSDDTRTIAADVAREAGGQAGLVFEHALRGFVFHGSDRAAEQLAHDPRVRTVIPDREVRIADETLPTGVRRIDARHPTTTDAHEQGFRGDGISVGVLDTGIDASHPDLVANIDAARGKNCMGGGPPTDGHGHGTHVAGTIAAVADNGIGVVGVAPSARIVPVKVLDDSGQGTTATVVCGIDHLTSFNKDQDPSNDIHVANMSLGDTGGIGDCADGGMREAICASVAAGIVYVAAAGNSTTDASTFYPANYPEVIAVSALTDLDGEPGGLGGACLPPSATTGSPSSATSARSSTWHPASVLDLEGGGYQNSDGTSMAARTSPALQRLCAEPTRASARDVRAVISRPANVPTGALADADGDGYAPDRVSGAATRTVSPNPWRTPSARCTGSRHVGSVPGGDDHRSTNRARCPAWSTSWPRRSTTTRS
jgi:subtilisin family serine protease